MGKERIAEVHEIKNKGKRHEKHKQHEDIAKRSTCDRAAVQKAFTDSTEGIKPKDDRNNESNR